MSSCGGNGDGMAVTPFGVWKTQQGHRLTIRTDGTYQLCKAEDCAGGSYNAARYSNLTVILGSFLSKPQLQDVAGIIRNCEDVAYRLTDGQSRDGLGPDDLSFDAGTNNILEARQRGAKLSNMRNVVVTHDCSEGRRTVRFTKVEDFPHEAAAEELQRLENGFSSVPPIRVNPQL